MNEAPIRLYDFPDSGNGYKVRLLLSQLGRSFELVSIDILSGESRTEEFRRLNPNGRIPVLQLYDGRYLAESNAMLYYLAQGTTMMPADRFDQAKVMQWLFFEQYSHEPNIATPRFWLRHLNPSEINRELLEQKQALGRDALAVMDEHLANNSFFVSNEYSIADIALYAYTHVADQGGFNIADYGNVERWLALIASQPGYRPLSDWLDEE